MLPRRRCRVTADQRRGGFTLLELMIALVAAALTLYAARLLISQIESAGITLADEGRAADAAANGERMLHSLVGRGEVSPDSTRRFAGDERSASFDSWCDRAAGWMERCRVTLTVSQGVDSSAITATLSSGESLHLADYPGQAALRYVQRDTAGVSWLLSWGRSIAAPDAIAIVFLSDTIVVRLGDRG